ncbi:hypothetical protein [Methylobacterium sp. V23]|uniref:hypothetical protein n=1 Tax=Methylobacterium sp. V23 TaxID=2044878 RepID=UPI000CDA925B|nr:hypothetical protein [Methylobacterium sp. V23]POR40418.1 hypothetical protein CRT23_24130 [Methylobacterium sp. V23]
MQLRLSQALPRTEVQVAREAEKLRIAQMAWTDLSDANQMQDEKIDRLKALRLARLAQQQD